MRRSTVLATLVILGTWLAGASSALAQAADHFPAMSPGAISFAALTATGRARGATDLYLTSVLDYGAAFGPGNEFSLDSGTSAIWGYQFFSPSLDSFYIVLVASQANTVFGSPASGSFGRGVLDVPQALDTTGAFIQSSYLAEQLRNDPDYQAFVAAHPNAASMAVQLRMLGPDWQYPLPPGFPTSEATWIVGSARFGDSVHYCYLATESGTMSCGETFNRSVGFGVGISTLSNVTFGTSNFGIFGMDLTGQQPAGLFEAPAGSGNNYIYGAGLWFGARKRIDGQLAPRVFLTYDPNSGSSWATPGEGYDDRTTYSFPQLFNSGAFNHETGAPDLGEFSWPLWLQSPDTGATYMDPGTFVGLNTDRIVGGDRTRPAFVAGATEQYVARYHDANLAQYSLTNEATGFPLGIQIQENIFAQPGGFDHTVILSYMIINRSADTLFDAVAGVVTDFDIVDAANDRSRFYTERPDLRTAIAWSGPEGRPTPLGVLAMTMLEAPQVDANGFLESGTRPDFRTDGEVGTYQVWSIDTDPAGSVERYAFMTAGDLDLDAGAGDRRGLLASKTFTMLPGDTAHYAIAYIVDRHLASTTGADPILEERIENVMNAYYGLQFSGVRTSESTSGALSMAVAPNPAREMVALRLDLERAGDATVEVFDNLGALVLARDLGELGAGRNVRTLDVADLASGAYVVVAKCGDARVSVPVVIAR
jgi:hypothetical protein